MVKKFLRECGVPCPTVLKRQGTTNEGPTSAVDIRDDELDEKDLSIMMKRGERRERNKRYLTSSESDGDDVVVVKIVKKLADGEEVIFDDETSCPRSKIESKMNTSLVEEVSDEDFEEPFCE